MKKLICLTLGILMALSLSLPALSEGASNRPTLTITGFGDFVDAAGDAVLAVEAVTEEGEEVKLTGDHPELWVNGAEYVSARVVQERDPNVVKEYYTMEDLILARVEVTVSVSGEAEHFVCTLEPDARFYYEAEDGMVHIIFDKEQFLPESEMETES